MNPNSKEFKNLQKKWYTKLAKKGFRDIEKDDNSGLREYHSYSGIQSKYSSETFFIKQEYYIQAHKFYHDHKFDNKTLKFIWKEHMEGTSVRAISLMLKDKGIDMPKSTVNDKIRALAKKMKETYSNE